MPSLSPDDFQALCHLRVVHRFIGRGRSLLSAGEPFQRLRIIVKGWAMHSRRHHDRRQILDLMLAGDVIGLETDGQHLPLTDVEALTPCEVGEIDLKSLHRIALRSPGIAGGLTRIVAKQLARAEDQILRLGQMTAYERVCHVLLDIHDRQPAAGIDGKPVDFPVTQTVLAALLGLSVVHVNRQVMRLREEGLIVLTRQQLVLCAPERMASIAGIRPLDRGGSSTLAVAAE
jgi:CRP-like cAMP-binding protein